MARASVAPKHLYPPREGNRLTLMCDAVDYLPKMLEAIEAARHTILLEMYLFESGGMADSIISALEQAAQRGVRVYSLIDDFGSGALNRRDRERLDSHGLQLIVYNPLRLRKLFSNVYRDHRKQLTIDGRLCFTGGTGISDVYLDQGKRRAWRETMVAIEGPLVADWQEMFEHNWFYWSDSKPLLQAPLAQAKGEQSGQLVATHGGERLALKAILLNQINNARERVWITTAYLMPSRKLRRALRQADQRGVDVRLLVPGKRTDHPSVRYAGRRFYRRLLRDGVRIYEYQPRFIHAKVILCDQWSSIGSANLDRWSLRWTLEANLISNDKKLAAEIEKQFLRDLHSAHEINYQQWLTRPRRERFLEWFWMQVDRMVERVHHLARISHRNPWHNTRQKKH